MTEIATIAKGLPFGDWPNFFAGAAALLFVMLAVRFFVPDRLLPRPKVQQLLFATPILVGAAWGYANWTGSAGEWSGLVWGGVMGAAAHVEWAVIALAVKLWHRHSESAATSLLGRKFGIQLKDEQSAAVSAPEGEA